MSPSKSNDKNSYAESQRLLEKFPTRVPIIVTPNGDIELEKTKFLVPAGGTITYKDKETGETKERETEGLTMQQLMYVIRRKTKLTPEEAIYMFVNEKMPNGNALVKEIYEKHKNSNGFLYIDVSTENTFG